MKKLVIFLVVLFGLGACVGPDYVTIDKVYDGLEAPVTLVSRSAPNYNGDRVYKVRDGKGKTYTCEDNSLSSVPPGTVLVPYKPDFEKIDKTLEDAKAPVMVIGKGGKYGSVLKLQDAKGKIFTVDDITLADYQIGDRIK
jgi:hypothetical protein